MATKLLVVYSTASGLLRRKIVPEPGEPDTVLDAHLSVAPGESSLFILLTQPYDDAACRAAIKTATGLTPPSGRCCVVNASNAVVHVCMADPAIDKHPAGTLVAHDLANIGDTLVAGVFMRQYAVVSSVTNIVTAIATLPVVNPTVSAGTYLMPAFGHKVGDVIVPKTAAHVLS